ncbi:hypothetical protein QFW80_11765 [Luteimonas sp. M1R5S18]|jgi:hypothetical protein|uniref:Uncharacterized protein n=1 Tax=Luteimonas rhizosphaericola TaxID=3042024 RepID=A0ABT6JL75_9GAMM|nr:hypothetical protein [Luteimonas rhizosphaericola]MDH5831193.1 hypothetical protein [Luteimonas rhizosphaericola]
MTQILYAQDEAGNRHKVIQRLESPHDGDGHDDHGAARLVYTLDDGSPVRRVDNDTFQIVGSGAYITAISD